MNRSGSAVKGLMRYMKAELKDLLVVCDDFNLPLGKMRLRQAGSAGGHNGLQSIIDALGTSDFPRLRLGIGGSEVIDKTEYVLKKFPKAEFRIIEDMLISTLPFVECYIRNGIEDTMNRFN